jgi:hypothetical protein
MFATHQNNFAIAGAFYIGKNASSIFAPIWRKRCVAALRLCVFRAWLRLRTFLFKEKQMNIKVELLKDCISDYINSKIEDFEIDASKIADTTATQMLSEIQKVIKNESFSDFEIVEEIVCIFEKYNIDFGCQHDF